jgi:HlyD family secretion protein
MKKYMAGLVTLALMVGLAVILSSCSQAAPATPAGSLAKAAPTALPPVKAEGRIVSDAKVVPARYATLSLNSGGTVAEILVQEGGQVTENQLLVRLAAPRQEAAVAQAQAEVQKAQARVNELKAGPRPQEVASAKAALDAAQAQLAKLQQGPRNEEVAAAQAQVAAAQASLQQVLDGADEPQRIAASAELANAEAALRQAQSAYDRVKGRADIGAMPESVQLEQATNAFNAAKARLADLQKAPRAGTLATAQAQVQSAKASLDVLKAPAREADVSAAKAEIDRVQAQLDLLNAGTRAETLAVAEADLATAQAGVAAAQAALAENELRSPFAGTVAKIDVRVGEQVAPGAAMVRLGDQSEWQIETTDLTELNVVRVREGSPATVTFDALPDVKLPGKVIRINNFGENRQGDIVYAVVVKPDQQEPRLRWNMTASVSIEPEQ